MSQPIWPTLALEYQVSVTGESMPHSVQHNSNSACSIVPLSVAAWEKTVGNQWESLDDWLWRRRVMEVETWGLSVLGKMGR